ncbi:MAG: phosphate ABC transporter permease subunit PstC [Candidatus Omnitrophica bacterium]|nr:phosphate ABC transporter permease subunit PstC [Candidatus Omnitrophota bacterium]MCM8810792.1 phosphate ABC transporter permease subunit PstC [Candidatus Omnitrophota bacterium]MCM8833556.1 phosphate ABC transporter permease subunit PstC [Candidatus Omnitrophota bacterium]
MNWEKFYKKIMGIGGAVIIGLLLSIFITLILNSIPSIKNFKFKFIIDKIWDPVFEKFGALPFIAGTILTSVISLIISIPFSLSLSLFIGEYYKDTIISKVFETFTEIIAVIPSVIFGLWGLFYLAPIIRNLQLKFSLPPTGVSILTASLILSIMIIPYATSIGKEVIKLVPVDLKEAAFSFGATRYEVIKKVIFPYAKGGIFAGFLLSFGRAIGETMAVTMVIGNSNFLTFNIFKPGNTIASIIANEFTEAVGNLHLSSLIQLGLILFLITFIINFFAYFFILKKQVIKI